MPRPRGTYATIDNWVRKLAPTLPGAAGWVLLELSNQSNYRKKTMNLGDLVSELPYEVRAVQKALAFLVAEGYARPEGKAYGLVSRANQARTSGVPAVCTDVRGVAVKNALSNDENTDANSGIQTHTMKEEEGRGKEGKPRASVLSDASLPALQPVQTSESEQIRADAQTADAVPEALPSPEMFKPVQAIPETTTPPVGLNTSRAAPRAELPPLPVPPAAAFFAEVTGAFFAKVQAQHLARWHGQYTPEFIVLAWRLSALEERPTFAFADWLDRSPNKPWPASLRSRYELDVAPELASETGPPKPRELPVKPGDLVRWADGSTATVERCERVDFVTDHEDDARGYVPYSAVGRSVEVLHS